MLKNNVDETIELSAAEYRMMVEDNWDWMNQWLVSNSTTRPRSVPQHWRRASTSEPFPGPTRARHQLEVG